MLVITPSLSQIRRRRAVMPAISRHLALPVTLVVNWPCLVLPSPAAPELAELLALLGIGCRRQSPPTIIVVTISPLLRLHAIVIAVRGEREREIIFHIRTSPLLWFTAFKRYIYANIASILFAIYAG